MLRNYCTSPDARVGARRAAPVDAHLAAADAIVHARDAAIGVTRAGTQRDIIDIEVFTSCHEVGQLQIPEKYLFVVFQILISLI